MGETRDLFRQRVERAGGVRAVAQQLGITSAYVTMLQTGAGGKLPGLRLARRIEDLLGVPMRAWAADDA